MTQVLTINSEPVVFFEYTPNWRQPVSTVQEYKTDIFTAYSGGEQRRALRQTPRTSYEYTVSLSKADKRAFDTLMAGRLGHLFAMAEPSRFTTTIYAALAGTTRMSIAAEPTWLKEGMLVAVSFKDAAELRIVQTVEGQEVVFSSSTSYSWPKGTKLRPAHIGRFDGQMPTKQLTSDVTEASLSFMVEPATESYSSPGVPAMFFDGLEVMTKRPNWANPISVDYEAELSILDFERGQRLVENPVAYNRRMQKAGFLGRNRAEADYIEGLFHRMRGRRGRFYAPSWSRDMEAEVALTGGDSVLVISDLDYYRFLTQDPTRKRIVVALKNGDLIPNYITGASTPSGGWGNIYGLDYGGYGTPLSTTIGVRDPWPQDISLDEIASISWLLCSRFGSDSLTLSWETDTVSQFQFTLQAIEDNTPEDNPFFGWGMNYGNYYGGSAA